MLLVLMKWIFAVTFAFEFQTDKSIETNWGIWKSTVWVATTQRKQEKLWDSFGDHELKKSRDLEICLIHKLSTEINIKN